MRFPPIPPGRAVFKLAALGVAWWRYHKIPVMPLVSGEFTLPRQKLPFRPTSFVLPRTGPMSGPKNTWRDCQLNDSEFTP